MKKETQCVHSGTRTDREFGGLNTPIHTSSSFRYLQKPENLYPRYYNIPNQASVAEKLCVLEKGEDGLLFGSGMAAISTVLLSFLNSGDHAVLQRDIYGGTHHFVTADFKRFEISHSFTSNDIGEIESAIRPNTKLIYIESPSNPLVRITDIEAVSELAVRHKILTVIDNTFATPINQNPLELGIDVVVHSGTKYLGGHSDLCCGAAVASRRHIRKIRETAANLGGSMNAQTAYLLERSLKTLSLRVSKQNANALALAMYLEGRKGIKKVYYPGLESDPGHSLARRQMSDFGGMLAFELDGSSNAAEQFLNNLNLITPALSLGGVETIICSPAATSHEKISADERAELGISDNLLRLSVGIEGVADLTADIDQALR